jgi:hypothetical protein
MPAMLASFWGLGLFLPGDDVDEPRTVPGTVDTVVGRCMGGRISSRGRAMNPTIDRLRDAINRHDAEGMAVLFAPDYRSEQPAHPNRGFGGAGQVAANWGQMFAGVPDLVAEVLSEATDGSTTWSEWAWTGHHADGSDFAMKGCTVMGLRDDGAISWARLYMEPVEQDGAAIEEAVQRLSGTPR